MPEGEVNLLQKQHIMVNVSIVNLDGHFGGSGNKIFLAAIATRYQFFNTPVLCYIYSVNFRNVKVKCYIHIRIVIHIRYITTLNT